MKASGFLWVVATLTSIGVCTMIVLQQPAAMLPPLPKAPAPVEPLAVAPLPEVTAKPEPPRCPAAGTTIALIGDSYAEGIGPHLEPLALNCGVTYVFDWRRGTSVTQWIRDTWIGPVLDHKPDFVLISLGGNDFIHNDPAALQEATNTLVARIRKAGARVLWVEPLSLPYPDQSGTRPMWKAAVGDNSWFASEHLEYGRAKDKVHTSYANYRRWAKLIWPWVVRKTHEES